MPEEDSLQQQVSGLTERLDRLELLMLDQATRLAVIEQQQLHPGQSQPPATAHPLQRTKEPIVPLSDNREEPHLYAAEASTKPSTLGAAKPPPHSPPHSASSASSSSSDAPAKADVHKAQADVHKAQADVHKAQADVHSDLETRIGGGWFNRIGIIAIAIGVAFFLKYAFDNQWIGPAGRVLIGIILGAGFVAAGEIFRTRKYHSYAHGLSGGGIIILYLSVYTAVSLYGLINHTTGFLAMALITATAVLLAARYSALTIAALGLIGGFLTPVLLATGVDNEAGLFSYVALLDAGVLALAYYKQWRRLNYTAFILTALMFAGWMIEWYGPEKLWPTVFFLTVFFVLFALLPIVNNALRQRPTQWLDVTLILANASLYFGTSYALLDAQYHRLLGSFALLMASFYLGLGTLAVRRSRDDRLLNLIFIGVASIFVTLAVPIQLDQQWVTIGWGVEGAVLTWIGLRAPDRTSRYAALLVFAVAVGHWFSIDMVDVAYRANTTFVPLLNRRAASCAALIAALVAARWLYGMFNSNIKPDERATLMNLLLLAANVLLLTLLSVDIDEYFEQAKRGLGGEQATKLAANLSSQFENRKQLLLSLWWTLYGGTALVIGLSSARGSKPVRYGALALLALAVLKLLAIDAGYYDASWHTPIFNETFVAFAALVFTLGIGVWVYRHSESIDERERTTSTSIVVAVANVLAIIALSLEASGYFAVKVSAVEVDRIVAAEGVRDVELARQLSLSVIWAIYGGGILVIGIVRGTRLLRVMALLLLSFTIIKVFLVDFASLDRIYRIVSFILLGVILLAVSFLYQRHHQQRTNRVESR